MHFPHAAGPTSRRTNRISAAMLPRAMAVVLATLVETSIAAHAQEYCTRGDACDDGNACTLDGCNRYTCVHFGTCDDHDPCTKDTCKPAIGCVHTGITCASTTTSTVPVPIEGCGDANDDGVTSSLDALMALRAAVSVGICDPCFCDVTGDGLITAGDSLNILRYSVGWPIFLDCPQC